MQISPLFIALYRQQHRRLIAPLQECYPTLAIYLHCKKGKTNDGYFPSLPAGAEVAESVPFAGVSTGATLAGLSPTAPTTKS